jgi:inorganic pyrophosphatase
VTVGEEEIRLKHQLLSDLAVYDDSGALRIVIETPKGSRNKYDYNPESNAFELSKVLPEGMSFPFDFGFVPSTLGEDGDPLDVLILMDAPGVPGCTLNARALGAIEARQKEKGGDWFRNDRLIAIASQARIHERAKSIDDLGPHVLKDMKAFFIQYNELFNKRFECLKDVGPKGAAKLIEAGQRMLRKKRS